MSFRNFLTRTRSNTENSSVRSEARSANASARDEISDDADESGNLSLTGKVKLKNPFVHDAEELFIQLNEPHKIYGPGDIVCGHVNLSIAQPTRSLYITIKFSGQVSIGRGSQRARKTLFQQNIVLWGEKSDDLNIRQTGSATMNNDDDRDSSPSSSHLTVPSIRSERSLLSEGMMSAGRHVFDFEFAFPSANMPSSLDFGRGMISYTLRCEYRKPRAMLRKSSTICRKDITYLESIDVTSVPTPKIRHIDPDAKAKRREGSGRAHAYVELAQGACLKGDSLSINIQVHHFKPIKNMQGTIVTLYRLSRFDGRDLAPQSFRKDLSQSISPLLVDPRTLDYRLSTRVKVPPDAFPTIKAAGPVSFRYFVEVVIDLAGRTTVHQGQFFTNSRSTSSSYNIENGGDSMETDAMKREKGVSSVVFEVIVGTKSSGRPTGETFSSAPVPYCYDGAHASLRNHQPLIQRSMSRDSAPELDNFSLSSGLGRPQSNGSTYPRTKQELQQQEAALLPSEPPVEAYQPDIQLGQLQLGGASDAQLLNTRNLDLLQRPASAPVLYAPLQHPPLKEEEVLAQLASAPPDDVYDEYADHDVDIDNPLPTYQRRQ